jgi:hypothetical protein
MEESIICSNCEENIKLGINSSKKLKLSCSCSGFYSEHLDALQKSNIFPEYWKRDL